MVNCPICGKEVGEGMKFCPHCGAEISVDMEKVKIQLDELKHEEKGGIILLILGFILLIVGISIGLITETHEEWRGVELYKVVTHPYADFALFIMFMALIIVVIGGTVSVYYTQKRNKLMKSKGLK